MDVEGKRPVTFNPKALVVTMACLLAFALAGPLADAGASPLGAILIAGLVVAVGYGLIMAGFVSAVRVVAGIFVTLTVLRLLWKLVVFAWR
jgi:hypothetical protein